MSNKIIPATVFTGFLGSGKTTIITHLLEHLNAKGQKVAYLKNEIGDADLDAQLLRGRNFIGKEILNGCICCTLVGPFMAAIDELIDDYQMDRIIVESAGSADPASMALMISNHPRLRRDGVIVIIDTLNFAGFEDISHVARRQAELTDLIVLNKIELVDQSQKHTVVGYVRELNSYAPIVEAPYGRLNPDLAFGLGLPEVSELLKAHDSNSGSGSNHHHDSHDHLEEDQITAFTYETTATLDKKKLLEAIEKLPKNVFRIKGFAKFETGFQIVNAIFKRCDFSELPPGLNTPESTKLIIIGYKIDNLTDELSAIFNQCRTQV